MSEGDGERIERQEVEAYLETRRELGPSYEREIVDAFAERIERAVGARVGAAAGELQRDRDDERGDRQRQLTLGVVSLVTGIPITAIAAGTAELPGLAVSWLGIVGVNVAHAVAVSGRRRRRSGR